MAAAIADLMRGNSIEATWVGVAHQRWGSLEGATRSAGSMMRSRRVGEDMVWSGRRGTPG
jgi:hypothetical protein